MRRAAGYALGAVLLGALSAAAGELFPALRGTQGQGFWFVCLLGPLLEETVFRGIAYAAVKALFGEKAAVVVCAVLFALAHGSWPRMLAALPAGLFFGWIRKKEGGIAQPAAAHMAVNILIWIWNALRG